MKDGDRFLQQLKDKARTREWYDMILKTSPLIIDSDWMIDYIDLHRN